MAEDTGPRRLSRSLSLSSHIISFLEIRFFHRTSLFPNHFPSSSSVAWVSAL